MKTFKTYLEEGNNFYKAVTAGGLIGLAAITPGIVNTYKANRAAEQSMSQQDFDTMMDDINKGKPKQETKPNDQVAEPTGPQYHHDAIKQMVIADEGLRLKRYKDSKGIWTIGIGHNLEATDSHNSFNRAFGENGKLLRSHIMRGGSLTHDQAKQLFDADYDHHLQKAIKLTPNLHEHPPEVQAVIVSGTYRGHWGGSPSARKLFNSGKYQESAKELLNNAEYRAAKKSGSGVATRMERDANVIYNYGTSKSDK